MEGGGSLRLCAATRAARSPEDLIRFVAGPDGVLVPDLARKLPGRGVWVGADKASVTRAVAAKAFARSLKRPVEVAADLPEIVETLLARRALEALSIANKAGQVVVGFAQVDSLLDSGQAVALVHGNDAAEGGRDKLDRKFRAVSGAKNQPAPVVDAFAIQQISLAMGRTNVVHAGLIQGGATSRFLTEADRLVRYRTGIAVREATSEQSAEDIEVHRAT